MLNAEERGRVLWEGAVNDKNDPNANTNIYSYDWNGDYDNPVLNKVNITPFLGGDPTVPAGDTDWQDESYEQQRYLQPMFPLLPGVPKVRSL